MTETTIRNIEDITAICNEMKVKTLYLFGSGARETDFSDSGDLDFVYRFIKDEYPLAGYD